MNEQTKLLTLDRIRAAKAAAVECEIRSKTARDRRIKNEYAWRAEEFRRRALQLQGEINAAQDAERAQDEREERAHGPYLGGTPTGRGA